MSINIVIVDYGMGNLNSVYKTLVRLKTNPIISNNQKIIEQADKLILPGVGHFKNAMAQLNNLQLLETLNENILVKKKPILGICLGMQLMGSKSEEGNVNGLGWIDGDVIKFNINDTLKHKIPHIGWNSIVNSKTSLLMKKIPNHSQFYFVHSYHFKVANSNHILNETEYEYTFTSAIEKENIFGVQYHPEKSHDIGELLLKNFIEL